MILKHSSFVTIVREQSLSPQGSTCQYRLDFPDPYSVEQANDLRNLPYHDGLSISSVEMVITRKGPTKKQQTVSWMGLASHKMNHVRFPVISMPLASSISVFAKSHLQPQLFTCSFAVTGEAQELMRSLYSVLLVKKAQTEVIFECCCKSLSHVIGCRKLGCIDKRL